MIIFMGKGKCKPIDITKIQQWIGVLTVTKGLFSGLPKTAWWSFSAPYICDASHLIVCNMPKTQRERILNCITRKNFHTCTRFRPCMKTWQTFPKTGTATAWSARVRTESASRSMSLLTAIIKFTYYKSN